VVQLLKGPGDDYKNKREATAAAIPARTVEDGPTKLADDFSALSEAVVLLEAVMTLEEVGAVDAPVGALLPIIAEGPLDGEEGLLAARTEFGVAKGLAVLEPPVIVK